MQRLTKREDGIVKFADTNICAGEVSSYWEKIIKGSTNTKP